MEILRAIPDSIVRVIDPPCDMNPMKMYVLTYA